ncbi:GIY-YIG nuclease family protein [Pseudomonas sp. P115]|uniref:GIY-YIG nuclease family protein n=1 Tax=Pseudomonas pisciculturae TaxID=2730413 RepID=UPI0018924110|nr:GIY-YIG nuclease family protein [Pseudomonas pisciculturae]MBF6028448.1 GIY-YIG nuclease family protein [Pseudomonas pisciculturae]
MNLFDLLRLWEPTFSPESAKVHLARRNADEHPLDVFIQGGFDEWQSQQSNRNFKLPFVVSLIQAGSPTRWLFAGLFRVKACVQKVGLKPEYVYTLERVPAAEEWVGRLYLNSSYTKRNSYPYGETLAGDLIVIELLAERLSIGHFPGFKKVNLTKTQLDVVVQQNIDSWRSALSSVKGIYLITDAQTGKLYVGKADGEAGIWGRWCTYSTRSHGHNVALKREFGIDAPPEREKDLRFSLLEIADLHTMPGDIDIRESHWKEILLTRSHGYNLN